MSPKLLALFLFASLAFGQSTQVGGLIAYGGAARIFEDSASHAVGGVEACVKCGGRTGLFMEYQHWGARGERFTGNPRSLDLAGGGLRIQGRGSRVRPFFDIGLMVGREKNDMRTLPPRFESRNLVGGVLGFGAAISVTDHVYVRPMAKIAGFSTAEFGGFFGVGVGYRF